MADTTQTPAKPEKELAWYEKLAVFMGRLGGAIREKKSVKEAEQANTGTQAGTGQMVVTAATAPIMMASLDQLQKQSAKRMVQNTEQIATNVEGNGTAPAGAAPAPTTQPPAQTQAQTATDNRETTAKMSDAAQNAYNETQKAIVEKLAVSLKKNGNLVTMANRLGGELIELPDSDDEYRRIAKELIEDRKFTFKQKGAKGWEFALDDDGKKREITIEKMDKNLAGLATSMPDKYKEITDSIKADSLTKAIPDTKRSANIAKAVSDSVEENTGFFSMLKTLFFAVLEWIGGLFSKGEGKSFSEAMASATAKGVNDTLEPKLKSLGESPDNIKIVSDNVRDVAFRTRTGGPEKGADKLEKLADIPNSGPPAPPPPVKPLKEEPKEKSDAAPLKGSNEPETQASKKELEGQREIPKEGITKTEPDAGQQNHSTQSGQEQSRNIDPLIGAGVATAVVAADKGLKELQEQCVKLDSLTHSQQQKDRTVVVSNPTAKSEQEVTVVTPTDGSKVTNLDAATTVMPSTRHETRGPSPVPALAKQHDAPVSAETPDPKLVKKTPPATPASAETPDPKLVKKTPPATPASAETPDPKLVKKTPPATPASAETPDPKLVKKTTPTSSQTSDTTDAIVVASAASPASPSKFEAKAREIISGVMRLSDPNGKIKPQEFNEKVNGLTQLFITTIKENNNHTKLDRADDLTEILIMKLSNDKSDLAVKLRDGHSESDIRAGYEAVMKKELRSRKGELSGAYNADKAAIAAQPVGQKLQDCGVNCNDAGLLSMRPQQGVSAQVGH